VSGAQEYLSCRMIPADDMGGHVPSCPELRRARFVKIGRLFPGK
jgi:hypothetical protein